MVYENVKILCDSRKISIKELEKRVGLANGTIGKWRKSMPLLGSLVKVANYFGVSVESLLHYNHAG